MRKIRPIVLLLSLACMFTLFPSDAFMLEKPSGGVIIIANKSVPEDTLTLAEIKSIFLGEKSQWSTGRKIFFVLLKEYETHNNFLSTYIGKSVTQYNNHWKKLVFIGKGRTPTFFNTRKQVIDYVAGVEGAIGYIPEASIENENIKIIKIQE